MLTAIMVFNYVDRVALGLLLQDVKVDLALSDTQLGFLTGIAFALFYATMGIPIARWADRGNRVTIISFTTALWSVAVALCGAATSFVQLLIIRVGVAIGEAGCHPPAFSLIADHFTRAERPRAVAHYMLGFPIAVVIGYFAAGWLNELYGWRATFVIIGLPGVVLSALAAFTLNEPRRMKAAAAEVAPVPQPGLKEVFVTLWRSAAYRHLLFCFSLSYFFSHGISLWQPTFFVRSYGLASGELGTWLAAVSGLGSLLGIYVGGQLASRYAADNERLQLIAAAVLYTILAAIQSCIYLAPNHYLAFGMLALKEIVGGTATGPLFAATQSLVPARMRAMSIALILFCSNLIGMGFGPLAAGALSDGLRPWLGDESLRYTLIAFSPGTLWCAWHLWRARRTVTRDVAAAVQVEEWERAR